MVTLATALADMKSLLIYNNSDRDASDCRCLCCCSERLVAAVEAHLEARRHEAEMLVGLADLHRHGGE